MRNKQKIFKESTNIWNTQKIFNTIFFRLSIFRLSRHYMESILEICTYVFEMPRFNGSKISGTEGLGFKSPPGCK
jgi:hypothetical protein